MAGEDVAVNALNEHNLSAFLSSFPGEVDVRAVAERTDV
jgi:hypothetical protein